MTFEEELQQAVQQSVIKMVREGSLVLPDYAARAKIPAQRVQDLYDAINWDNVRSLVMAGIEQHVADKILNAVATEMATDVKQVLSNKELREEVRAFVRAGVRRVAEAA